MRLRLCSLTLTAVLLSAGLPASLLAAFDDRCPGASDLDHLLCTQDLLAGADGDLSRLYHMKRATLAADQDRLHRFVASEQAWIATKEARCHHRVEEYDVIGKTADIVFNDCSIEETRRRIDQLKSRP